MIIIFFNQAKVISTLVQLHQLHYDKKNAPHSKQSQVLNSCTTLEAKLTKFSINAEQKEKRFYVCVCVCEWTSAEGPSYVHNYNIRHLTVGLEANLKKKSMRWLPFEKSVMDKYNFNMKKLIGNWSDLTVALIRRTHAHFCYQLFCTSSCFLNLLQKRIK